jgi:hypothetical protein
LDASISQKEKPLWFLAGIFGWNGKYLTGIYFFGNREEKFGGLQALEKGVIYPLVSVVL